MKRILLLFSLFFLLALTSVMGIEGTAYTAVEEPVLIQQVFGSYFGIEEFIGITADPSKTGFSLLSLHNASDEVAEPEMSLSGLLRNRKNLSNDFRKFQSRNSRKFRNRQAVFVLT